MEKLKSSMANMVIVLVTAAVVTGAILAWVNHITEKPKQLVQQQSLNDDIRSVMGGKKVREVSVNTVTKTIGGKSYSFIVHKLMIEPEKVAGWAVESSEMGFGGKLTVLVGLRDDATILGYAIRQTAETPGLGAKAAAWFQKGAKGDIIGKNPKDCNLTVKKDGGDIDAITASTITSRAFLKAVSQAAEVVMENNKGK